MKTASRILLAGLVLALLAACGAKGPLFLPKDPPPTEAADTAEVSPDLPAEPPIESPDDATTTPSTNE